MNTSVSIILEYLIEGLSSWTQSATEETGYTTYFNALSGKMEQSRNVGGTVSTWKELGFINPNIVNGDMILAKMWIHSQVGMEGQFNIEASTLDFSMYNQKQLGLENMKIKESRVVNLFVGGVNSKSLAFGKIEMVALGNDQ